MTNEIFEAQNIAQTEYLQNHQNILKGIQELVRQGYQIESRNVPCGAFLATTLILGQKKKIFHHAQEI